MIAAAALAAFLSFSFAATEGEGLQNLAENLEKSRTKLEQEELKRRRVLSALYEINKKMRRAVADRAKLQEEKVGLSDAVEKLTTRLDTLEQTSARLKARLAERLRALHKLTGPTLARFLLSASNSSQLDRNLKILGLIAARDRDLIREYQAVSRELKTKKDRLDLRLRRMSEIEAELREREVRLADEQNTKNRILSGIRRKKLFALKTIQELRAQGRGYSVEDEAVLETLLRPSFAEKRGQLDWPVRGRVARGFGPERSEGEGWVITHKGVFLKADRGSAVQAVFEGRVVYVDEIPGFGGTVIVDHGDHYFSVYSHASGIEVREGQEISSGQLLARVDRSPLEADAGLYFEIRHFSEPDDPVPWMKGKPL